MKKYHWTYQCHRCFIKSGYGFTGTEAEASDNAPACCGDQPMHAIRGKEASRTHNGGNDGVS